MSNMDSPSTTMIAATSAIVGVATMFGAVLVHSARSDRALMEGVKRSTEATLIQLKAKESELKLREAKLLEDARSVEEQLAALKKRAHVRTFCLGRDTNTKSRLRSA